MTKILILFLFIITSCGYQPLYKIGSNSDNFEIRGVSFTGDKRLSEEIFLKLPITIKKNNQQLNIMVIDSKKEIQETSKNSKGQVTSLRTSISININFQDKNKVIKKQKLIKKEFSYNTDDNKFKLKEYQKKIDENLIDRIIEDIILHINS